MSVSSFFLRRVIVHEKNVSFLKEKHEKSMCQYSLCQNLVKFPVLIRIKPQAPLLVVPFRRTTQGPPPVESRESYNLSILTTLISRKVLKES